MDGDEKVDTVTLRKSDFEALQQAADAAFEDFQALASLLRFDWQHALTENQGLTPHKIMEVALLPEVARLVHTQIEVDKAGQEVRERAARFNNKTISQNGVTGLKVGQRIPGLFGPGS